MIIHKFGGTSIRNADDFLNVANIIRKQISGLGADARSHVVVLSAISGVPSALVEGARLAAGGVDSRFRKVRQNLLDRHLTVIEGLGLPSDQQRILAGTVEEAFQELERLFRSISIMGEITRRGLDAVKSIGPILSTHILSTLLQHQGVRARPINTTDILILDTNSGKPVPSIDGTRKLAVQHLLPALNEGFLPVCTASIGSTLKGTPAMLDQGGGDTSAAALAAALQADECWIWTDVDGILTADPAFTSEAVTIQELSYDQAEDLARFGADVIHPATLLPGNDLEFTFRIRSSFNPDHPGTLISRQSCLSSHQPPAILSLTGLSMIAIQDNEYNWSLRTATRILDSLNNSGVDVLMFNQPMSTPGLLLILRDRDCDYAIQCLKHGRGQKVPGTLSFDISPGIALITIVSLHVDEYGLDNNLFSQAFKIAGEHNTVIHTAARSASGDSLSFCIPEEECEKLIVRLHSSLVME